MSASQAQIMIVDDSTHERELLTDLLSDDFNLTSLDSGSSCLQLSVDIQPDIILLDVNMPDIDGLETCKLLKNNKNTEDIHILMLSGASSEDDLLKGYEAGCDDYITKPFNIDELVAKIKVCLKAKEREKKLAENSEHSHHTLKQEDKIELMMDFLDGIIKSNAPSQLSEILLDSTIALGLDCVIYFPTIKEPILLGATPDSLEMQLIEKTRADGRHCFHFQHRCALHLKHVSLLVRNLTCVNDSERENKVNELLMLLSGVEARIKVVKDTPDDETDDSHGANQMPENHTNLISSSYDIIGQVSQKFSDCELETHNILNQLRRDVDELLLPMGLTEQQENALLSLLDKSMEKLDSLDDLYSAGNEDLQQALLQLKSMIPNSACELF